MSSSKVDDGTLEVNTATVVTAVSGCAAGSKLGRHESKSATTLSRPGLYDMERQYSTKNDNHLAISCERCGLLRPFLKSHGPYK